MADHRKPSIFHYFSRVFAAELVSYSWFSFFLLLSQSRASAGNDLPCNLIWVPSGVKSSINSAVHSLAGTEREGIIIYCLLQSTSAAEFKLKKNFFALLFCCCSFSFMFIVPTFEFCKSIKGDVDRNVMPLRSVLISGFRGCIQSWGRLHCKLRYRN